MAGKTVSAGDVILVALPSHAPGGHEQEGTRPAIVAAVPKGPVRYPLVIVIPLTTQTGQWAKKNPSLYHQLPLGSGGLPRTSIALIDQVRALDVSRVQAYLGSLKSEIFEPIRKGLIHLFTHEKS